MIADGSSQIDGGVMDNAQIAWSFFEDLSRKDIDSALRRLNDAGTWWHVRDGVPYSMRLHKKLLAKVGDVVPMQFTLHRALEINDIVVLELESHSWPTSGIPYHNFYCFIATIWDGSILHMKEFNDTTKSNALPAEMRDVPRG